MTDSVLHAALLDAHEHSDHDALVTLYTQAAASADSEDAGCFFLTQAWIFALQCGHPDHAALQARLRAHGRA